MYAWFYLEKKALPTKGLTCAPTSAEREAQRRDEGEQELSSACASLLNAGAAERQSLVDKCNAAGPPFCETTLQIMKGMQMNTAGLTCERLHR
jgi:hypothetical protein